LFTVACSSHVKNLFLACGTRRGEGSREDRNTNPCTALTPNSYEGAVARNSSSKGIPEVHAASEGYLKYITFVQHVNVL